MNTIGDLGEGIYKEAAAAFAEIKGYADADEKYTECLKRAQNAANEAIRQQGIRYLETDTVESLKLAIDNFSEISGWEDADVLLGKAQSRLAEWAEIIRKREENKKIRKKKRKKIAIKISISLVCLIAIAGGIVYGMHRLKKNPWISLNIYALCFDDDVYDLGRTSEKRIEIPRRYKHIGDSAFAGCSSLTEITIPDSVTSIGHYAFDRCSSLTEITIPDSVTSIEDGVFCDCSSLTEITIPDSVTSIGEYAFWGCTNLKEITIPDSVTSIGEYAFGGCSSLTKITISEGVTSIEDGAFYGCSSLTEITIPDSVTSIGDFAFSGCSSLTEIYVKEESIAESCCEWLIDFFQYNFEISYY